MGFWMRSCIRLQNVKLEKIYEMRKQNILAHRGLWRKKEQQNTLSALVEALENGFGVETDLRDHNGEIAISHDPVLNSNFVSFSKFAFLMKSEFNGRVALNIKADGLQTKIYSLQPSLNKISGQYYFFDMSIPDEQLFRKYKLPVYSRVSEYEMLNSDKYIDAGVWIDNFTGDFDQLYNAEKLLSLGYRVTIVSPELHGRSYDELWQKLKSQKISANANLELCTDFPFEAYEFLGD